MSTAQQDNKGLKSNDFAAIVSTAVAGTISMRTHSS